MQRMEDLWHDVKCDDNEQGKQQGEGEEHKAQLNLFHERIPLSVRLRFPARHLERAALVV